jgi:uncharacterized protein (TIGR02246 family)
MTSSERAATSGDKAADEDSIRSAVEGLGEAWNRHDPQGMVQDFADELEHVSVRGHWQHTRAELEETYRRNHQGIWADVTFTPVVEQIRFLRPDVAVAIVQGVFRSAAGNEEPARSTWVFSKEGEQWLLRAFQQTYIQNVPIAPRSS